MREGKAHLAGSMLYDHRNLNDATSQEAGAVSILVLAERDFFVAVEDIVGEHNQLEMGRVGPEAPACRPVEAEFDGFPNVMLTGCSLIVVSPDGLRRS